LTTQLQGQEHRLRLSDEDLVRIGYALVDYAEEFASEPDAEEMYGAVVELLGRLLAVKFQHWEEVAEAVKDRLDKDLA